MGKGPKGGIWYAGEGEQDRNYLTQLVLQTWEENNVQANYFQANRQSQWFIPQNTTERWHSQTLKLVQNVQRREHVRLKLVITHNTLHYDNKQTR